jgi:hypothetical protein
MKLIASLLLLVLTVSINLYGQASFQDISTGNPIFSTLDARSIAIGDYDNDGDDDVLVGADPIRLYRNDGGTSFTEVAKNSGINYTASNVIWFDADDDGWLDFIAATFWQLRFYKNNGNGTFLESTASSGFFSASTQAFLVGDLNGDQLLDVYTNNLSKWNQLFINNGNGTFVDRVIGSGAEWSSMAMGGMLFDFDDDNDLDIYITFDGKNPNQLFINDGTAKFIKKADEVGLNWRSEAMGVDYADFNHDGKLDVYITNLFENTLLIHQPDGTYKDFAKQTGTDDKGMGWGVFCFDYNNDTFSDVYVVNAFPYNSYPNLLYKNNGDATFTNVASNSVVELKKNGYGGATGDFDSDGKPDIVVANFGTDGVKILRNTESNIGNWFEVNLVGTSTNKFGVGSRVEVRIGDLVLMDEVTIGSGYKSQNSYRVHVGLGKTNLIDELKIKWPDGTSNTYQNVVANSRYLAIQNESLTVFNATVYKQALLRPSQLENPPAQPEPDPRVNTGHSVARLWNEALLNSIRKDFARPTVHARNLFHFSAAMYDAWSVYNPSSSTYFLGKTNGGFYIPFTGFSTTKEKETAQEETLSFAAFRLLLHRFSASPGAGQSLASAKKLFASLGYDETLTSSDYSTGSPGALGNYIASKVIEFGLQDGANEWNTYRNQYYQPINQPFNPKYAGCGELSDPNRWQPLTLDVSIDQNGNAIESTPSFQAPEWGNVIPFAMKPEDMVTKNRDGNPYKVYNDPGQFPTINLTTGSDHSAEYIWNFSLVSVWGSHLDPSDSVLIDISPASLGNISKDDYPHTISGLRQFYNITGGGDVGVGYSLNPVTGLPYQSQYVYRGDYARVLAEFWADGPSSETPPGHWFSILNYVSDHPLLEKRIHGLGSIVNDLEWDVKAYFALGGALHDAAITAWSVKGYYDGVRPITAIRSLGMRGQSSGSNLPNYHPAGIKLIDGFIELVKQGDALAGENDEHINKVKLFTWRGPAYINNHDSDMAGVGWILAENWWPYQRPSFVSPPFAGYISGHSTYSRTAAEILTRFTGNEYFPGGMGEFKVKRNEFLVFEEGPSKDISLQWATYKDAADQCSLSRIWGGIHPPFDDIPGRLIGVILGENAYEHATKYFNGLITAIKYDIKLNHIDVYPNPVLNDSFLKVQFSEEVANVRFILVDLVGKKMFSEIRVVTGTETLLDIGNIPNGIYLLNIYSSTSHRTVKIAIKR